MAKRLVEAPNNLAPSKMWMAECMVRSLVRRRVDVLHSTDREYELGHGTGFLHYCTLVYTTYLCQHGILEIPSFHDRRGEAEGDC